MDGKVVRMAAMNRYQPLQDTINLLAGGRVPRTPRPEEQFPLPEKVRQRQGARVIIRAWVIRVLLILGVSHR